MAKITDPDLLAQGTEVTITPGTKRIALSIAGDLSTDGVTMQCLYSFLKEEWKDDADLIKYDFPMISITNEMFEFINGWDLADIDSKNLIRDGGWALKDTGGVSQEEYMNVTTLGSFNAPSTDKAYYLQSLGGTPTDIVLPGEVNQAVKIYGDVTHGDFDYRTFFQIFLREQGKAYAFGDLIADQSIAALTYKKYALPLSNSVDLKIAAPDIDIEGNAPYTGMSITWYGTPVERTIGGVARDFSIIIDANQGSTQQIYEFVQWSLRQVTDIDADGTGEQRGDIAEEMLQFVGDTLKTKRTSAGGVYIDDFNSTDTNNLVFVDDSGVERTFPYVSAGKISFNDNIINDASAKYWMFFTNDDAATVPAGNNFGTANAILVKKNNNADITGTVGGASEISFDFDYDGNVQRGAGSAGKNAPVTLIASGLGTAQYVKATGTIIKSAANNFSLVAALERNYSNAL